MNQNEPLVSLEKDSPVGKVIVVTTKVAKNMDKVHGIYYISGLTEFDKVLKDKPVHELKGYFEIAMAENAVIFTLLNSNGDTAKILGLWRSCIVNYEKINKQQIKVEDQNVTINALRKYGYSFGIIPGIIGSILKSTLEVKSKIVEGTIFRLVFQDSDGTNKCIEVGSEYAWTDFYDNFFKRYFKKELATEDKTFKS